MKKIIRFLRSLFLIFNPKTWGVFSEIAMETKFDAAVAVGWSQGGEDFALLHLALKPNGEPGSYLDIGAHHPNRFSVTRHFYKRGWSGINVDANPELEKAFLKWRPRDSFINKAVGAMKEFQFSIFEEPAISTSNPEWREQFLKEGNLLKREITVPGITLKELVLNERFTNGLDILNIDIEGSDFDALSSIDFPNLAKDRWPKWLVLESTPPVSSALSFPAVEYAISNGYIAWLVLPMGTILKSPSAI